jgi:predicted dehydrogenase
MSKQSHTVSRRQFIRTTSAAAIASTALSSMAIAGASEKVIVGIMGASRSNNGGNGRGSELALGFAGQKNAEVAYICDVDERHMGKAVEVVAAKQARKPEGVSDFRRIIDDPAVDAIVIATPDHWHAPATIFACAANKHVYVEKPACHNPAEGEMMLAAARKFDRRVQLGTQRRSWPGIIEAMQRIKAGEIGRVLLSHSYYFNNRPTIGRGRAATVPAYLNYNFWQGPAPERGYRDNFLHYNWHWFWHWGTGELGNNGVHYIDLQRWGMGVDYPSRITSAGGKYRYDDDQETPDTHNVSYDFGDRTIIWQGRSWMGKTPSDPDFDVGFYGDKGSLLIRGGEYTIYDMAGKEVAKGSGPAGDSSHQENFLNAIRSGEKLNAEIEEGVKSTLMCHLGNIAHRVGRALNFDTGGRRIKDDADAMGLWSRQYRQGWEPKV